jgi:hypothetical protein
MKFTKSMFPLCVLLLSLSSSTQLIYLFICITLLIYFVKIFSGTGKEINSFIYLRLFHPIGGHHYIPGHHFMPICKCHEQAMHRDPIFVVRSTFRSDNCSSRLQYWWRSSIFVHDGLPMDSQDPQWKRWASKWKHLGTLCWHNLIAQAQAIVSNNSWGSLLIITHNLNISSETVRTHLSWIDRILRARPWIPHIPGDNLKSARVSRYFGMLFSLKIHKSDELRNIFPSDELGLIWLFLGSSLISLWPRCPMSNKLEEIIIRDILLDFIWAWLLSVNRFGDTMSCLSLVKTSFSSDRRRSDKKCNCKYLSQDMIIIIDVSSEDLSLWLLTTLNVLNNSDIALLNLSEYIFQISSLCPRYSETFCTHSVFSFEKLSAFIQTCLK